VLRSLVLVLLFCLKAEQGKSKEFEVSDATIRDILEEASQIKVTDVKQIGDNKDVKQIGDSNIYSVQPAAPPPPNLPEPPAF
jgi:hypothetical protein